MIAGLLRRSILRVYAYYLSFEGIRVKYITRLFDTDWLNETTATQWITGKDNTYLP